MKIFLQIVALVLATVLHAEATSIYVYFDGKTILVAADTKPFSDADLAGKKVCKIWASDSFAFEAYGPRAIVRQRAVEDIFGSKLNIIFDSKEHDPVQFITKIKSAETDWLKFLIDNNSLPAVAAQRAVGGTLYYFVNGQAFEALN